MLTITRDYQIWKHVEVRKEEGIVLGSPKNMRGQNRRGKKIMRTTRKRDSRIVYSQQVVIFFSF